jgi:hypothetical protein
VAELGAHDDQSAMAAELACALMHTNCNMFQRIHAAEITLFEADRSSIKFDDGAQESESQTKRQIMPLAQSRAPPHRIVVV